jgi:replicative DNA helicase
MSKTDLTRKRGNRTRPESQILEQFKGLGKLPPQAVDLEEAVLGAMMLESDAVVRVIDILKADSFYRPEHRMIFSAIFDLFQTSQPIDILTVTQKLRNKGELEVVGGPGYVAQLTSRVLSSANIEFHARVISQKHIQRELIRLSGEIIEAAYEETSDVLDLLDKAESGLFEISEGNLRKQYASMSNLLHEAITRIEKARSTQGGLSGIPSGFTGVDAVTGGWQRSDMVVIAARPGMGKTAFVLTMARNMAVEFQIPVVVFSLEMSAVQLVQRLISSEAEISQDAIKKGTLADHEVIQLHQRIGRLAEAPIFIDDSPGLSIFELRAKCRRLKSAHGIQMVIIDYLQLMNAGGEGYGNREQEISTISRSIKSLAKELDVPIIALSQLSRSVESRTGERVPVLSDLRESGAIEQDADIVSFIYRPEYYGLTEDSQGNPTQGIGKFIIAKHRNGETTTIDLRFIGRFAKFANLSDFDSTGPDTPRPMAPNANFGTAGTMTFGSKMNTMDDDDYTPESSFIPPF